MMPQFFAAGIHRMQSHRIALAVPPSGDLAFFRRLFFGRVIDHEVGWMHGASAPRSQLRSRTAPIQRNRRSANRRSEWLNPAPRFVPTAEIAKTGICAPQSRINPKAGNPMQSGSHFHTAWAHSGHCVGRGSLPTDTDFLAGANCPHLAVRPS